MSRNHTNFSMQPVEQGNFVEPIFGDEQSIKKSSPTKFVFFGYFLSIFLSMS